MAEALGGSISKAKEEGGIQGIPITSGLPSFTHQQFVCDTMLFGHESVREASAFKGILNSYMLALGQEVNLAKSIVFMFNIDPSLGKVISNVLEISKGTLPCKYLGIPLDKGRRTSKLWDNLVDRIKSRINTWKGKWLSSAGRATLVRSVLSAMPIYQLSCQHLSSSKLAELNKHLRTFFWQGANDNHKISLISWDKICKPKEEEGVGIKNIRVQGKALGSKLVWRMFISPHLKWAHLLHHKYLNGGNPIQIFRETNPPRGSFLWNFMLDCRRIISDRLTWNLGSRDKALFWLDSWGGYKAINNIHDFGASCILLESHRGPLLNNYISPSEDGAGW